jgi:hypothetical protein
MGHFVHAQQWNSFADLIENHGEEMNAKNVIGECHIEGII